jgi:hypothetical protein
MLIRIRIAMAVCFLLTLTTSIPAFAKGGYSFIMILGPKLSDPVYSTDPALTTDFFAFAVFHESQIEAPSDPGTAYEITRYYTAPEKAFDRLHYYPETGFVYYDGIVNGSSEYDGKWYRANPAIKSIFENVIHGSSQNAFPAGFVTAVLLTTGAAAVLLIGHRRRRVLAS